MGLGDGKINSIDEGMLRTTAMHLMTKGMEGNNFMLLKEAENIYTKLVDANPSEYVYYNSLCMIYDYLKDFAMAYATKSLLKIQLEIDKSEDNEYINAVENELRKYEKLIDET